MIGLVLFIFLIVISITLISIFLFLRKEKESKLETQSVLKNVFSRTNLCASKIVVANKYISLAINKKNTILYVIEGFNPNNINSFQYYEIPILLIKSIEINGNIIQLNYLSKGEKKTLFINSKNKELKDFIYRVYKYTNIHKIEEKFPDINFTITSACDWQNSYLWAYSPQRGTFAYAKTTEKKTIRKFDLKKAFFTIDTYYKYFEAPILGQMQQLFIYEENFLNELYVSIFQSIKEKTSQILEDKIYYDSFNNIVYLSNGISSLQSILLDRVEEVNYRENRIAFTLFNSEKTINFLSDEELNKEFDDFVTNYNLRKIANSFNYKTDKLINTTHNTKFIIDISRDRIVYCANLNTFSKFSFLIIEFNNLQDATLEKTGNKYFVRIFSKDNSILDVSCKKYEVAEYILAQIKIIANS